MDRIAGNESLQVKNLAGSSSAFFISNLFGDIQKDIVCIMPGLDEAKIFYEDLVAVLGEDRVEFFPAHQRQAWSEVGPISTVVGRRITALKSMMQSASKVYVLSAAALIEKVADAEQIQKRMLDIKVGDEFDFEKFVEQIVRLGFVREERVDRPGEMSVRGGIVDVFLFENIHPVRIEFFGNQVESIRLFDVETQKSIDKIKDIQIFPNCSAGPYGTPDEHPLDRLSFSKTVLDFFSNDTVLFFSDYSLVVNSLEDSIKEVSVRLESFVQEHGFPISFEDYYLDLDLFEKNQENFQSINNVRVYTNKECIDFNIQESQHFAGNLDLFQKQIVSTKDSKCYLLCESESQKKRFQDLLFQHQIDKVICDVLEIKSGFSWPDENIFVYTDKELYSRVKTPRLNKIESRAISYKVLSSINRGDFVVHTDHGVGVFMGLKKIDAYGKERECLMIEYQDRDMLYVPLEKMDRVQKYSSSESAVPQLNKLGTVHWEKLKKRTKKRIREIAEQLIKLYATRKMQKGYAFSKDTVWQGELEASFKYDETIDQLSAIEDIKKDMESDRPMDRLVCGDVGYGKTEVAIRAAFKAISDNKQVAVLVPTTILAQQHFETFSERFRSFPVRVDMISRFRTPQQQKAVLKSVAAGEVDLLVGTHRILSEDVKFKNLGFLIVDEEQRFGVLHKEKLKLLKSNVDTLSLSATPIPRTMHMSLIGAKDMSLINSPPSNRLPIKTEVSRFDKDLIREIIIKEIDRNGQIYFVHNRVQSIYSIANLVRDIVPEVSIAVAHGQMQGHELEKVMHAFAQKKVQCLICTMIIESGIDFPNANTLIVNRADRFGLAQLYQLRGRVGRSDQQAYAYLLIPSLKKLNRIAIKRLQTIQELTHLGSGYKVAMKDLEIRGAGNIFGAQQSGFVDALGYELYNKIIEETILELRRDLNLEPVGEAKEKEQDVESKVEMAVDAYLPDYYVKSPAERVDIYRRLVEMKNVEGVESLIDEMRDRFGPLPQKAENLFNYILLKILSKSAKLHSISLRDGKLVGKFNQQNIPKGEQFRPWLSKIVQGVEQDLELKQEKTDLLFELKFSSHEEHMETAKNSCKE